MLAKLALTRVLAREFGSLDAGLEAAAMVKVRKLKRAIPKGDEEVAEAALESGYKAAEDIFDRFDGRPAQAIEASGPDGGPIEFLGGVMTDDQAAARVQQILAVAAERSEDDDAGAGDKSPSADA